MTDSTDDPRYAEELAIHQALTAMLKSPGWATVEKLLAARAATYQAEVNAQVTDSAAQYRAEFAKGALAECQTLPVLIRSLAETSGETAGLFERAEEIAAQPQQQIDGQNAAAAYAMNGPSNEV